MIPITSSLRIERREGNLSAHVESFPALSYFSLSRGAQVDHQLLALARVCACKRELLALARVCVCKREGTLYTDCANVGLVNTPGNTR